MLKKLYNWIIEKSKHPHAIWYLGFVSFLESSVSFLPPDPMIVAMIVADRTRAWLVAFVATITSAVGGILGYTIGLFLFARLGIPILKAYGLMNELAAFQQWFYKWGTWAIILKGFTPIPFKLVTITCGAIKFSFWKFLVSSIISRGVRFFIEAAILWKFGPQVNKIIERHIFVISISFVAVLAIGFMLLRYL